MATVSLAPAQTNFQIYEGATFRQVITVLTSGVGSPPVVLNGYTAVMNVKDVPVGDLLMQLTTENGGIVIDGPNGTVSLYIPDTTTNLLGWRSAVYELLLREPSGDVDPILRGNLSVVGLIY